MTYEAWRISYQSSEQAARAAYAECARLQAKIEAMEQQEPVVWMQSTHLSSFKNRLCGSQSSYVHCSDHQLHPDFEPLYALPGAQPAPIVPDATVLLRRAAMAMEVVGTEWRESDPTLRLDLASALAAAPEAKP